MTALASDGKGAGGEGMGSPGDALWQRECEWGPQATRERSRDFHTREALPGPEASLAPKNEEAERVLRSESCCHKPQRRTKEGSQVTLASA